jgi:hypothetical protein
MEATATTPAGMGDLAATLRTIVRFLDWVVRDSGLVRTVFQADLAQTLPDIRTRVEDAARQIVDIDDEGSELFKVLQLHGLTGAHLTTKLALGRQLAQELAQGGAPPAPAPPKRSGVVAGIIGRALEPFLKWINILLGSLSSALPGLGAVKEYKECLELSIDVAKQVSTPPDQVLPS